MKFDEAFTLLLGSEGGYSNNPRDPGGETMWGVTKRVAVANGYTGPMKDFPVSTAKEIYRFMYWDSVRADDLPADVRYAVFDAAVNSGVGQAARWLQRACGTVDDGEVGSKTIYLAHSIPPDTIVRRMLAARLRFMTDLKAWPEFSRGWSRRIASLLEA